MRERPMLARGQASRPYPPRNDRLLVADGVSKTFGPTRALRGVDLAIAPAEIVAIIGESGSGKSTLLLCLGGVLDVDAGTVCYRGVDVAHLRRRARIALRRTEFGFVFQGGLLVPDLSAVDNVALPLMLSGEERRAAERVALSALDDLDVAGLAQRRPSELSGGEAQRIAIARALVVEPTVVFADEPTGSLDSRNGALALDLLVRQVRERSSSLVLVTHSRRVAEVADRVIVMRDGEIVGARE